MAKIATIWSGPNPGASFQRRSDGQYSFSYRTPLSDNTVFCTKQEAMDFCKAILKDLDPAIWLEAERLAAKEAGR